MDQDKIHNAGMPDEQENDWKDLAPTLSKLKKGHNSLSVPDGYFDALPQHITDRILAEEQASPSFWERISGVFRSKRMVPVALGTMAIVVCILMLNRSESTIEKEIIAEEEVSGEELFDLLAMVSLSDEESNLLLDDTTDFFQVEASKTTAFETNENDTDLENYFEWDNDLDDFITF